jgi:isopenicillin-N N-acyltransferase-like protein
MGLSREETLRFAREFEPVLAKHAPHLLAEMRGIAAGSRRSLAEILVVNARTELLSIATRPPESERGVMPAPEPAGGRVTPGCTSVALTGSKGQLALGQNWDWRPEIRPALLRIRRRGAPDLITFTEAGMVGKVGCNARRVGVCLNFLKHSSERHRRPAGVPVHVLLRLAMESPSLDRAASRVSALPRSASANLLLAQHTRKGPQVADLELTPSAWTRLSAPAAGMIHANHFLGGKLRHGCARKTDPTTLSRQRAGERIARELQRSVPDPVARAKRVLSDRSSSTPISRERKDGAPTRASIVMSLDASQGPVLHLTGGPPHRTPYVRYNATPGSDKAIEKPR